MALPPWLAALAVFYGGVAVEIVRRALQPTCRNCLYRHACLGRRTEQYCYSTTVHQEVPNRFHLSTPKA